LGRPARAALVVGAVFDHELEHVNEFNDYRYIDQHHIDDESTDAVNSRNWRTPDGDLVAGAVRSPRA
jgi:hypothetical protein